MNSRKLINCLLSVTKNVSRFFSKDKIYPYIVWRENGEGSEVAGDNKKIQYSMLYSVDVFFKVIDVKFIKKLENAFNDCHLSFQLTDVVYSEDTEIINYHYEVEI